MLGDDEIERTLTTCDDPLRELLKEANNRGGSDNISVAVIQVVT